MNNNSKELHINKGAMTSASNKRISMVYFPVYNEGELIGNLTGDDLKFALNAAGFDIIDNFYEKRLNDERKTSEILKQNGVNDTYQDYE